MFWGLFFKTVRKRSVNLLRVYIPVPGNRRPEKFSRNRGTVNPPITHKKKK